MPLADWLYVPSVCTVDKQADRCGTHTVGHWGTVIQRAQTTSQSGAHSGAHWGIVNCTYRGHIQPDIHGAHTVGHIGAVNCTYIGHSTVRQEPTGALSIVHAEGTDDKLVDGGGGTEDTDNQTDSGHTGALLTVHTEDTDNQTDKEAHIVGHTGALSTVDTESTNNH